MSAGTAVYTGSAAVAAIAAHREAFDRAPAFCQQTDWLSAAATRLPGEPVLVLDVDEQDAVVGHLALVAHRRFGRPLITTLAGDLGDYAPVAAADPACAARLVAALRGWLDTTRPWLVRIDQLDVADPLTLALLDGLPTACLVPGAPMPQLVDPTPQTNVGRNRRKAMNQARNRLVSDGAAWSLDCLTGPGLGPQIDATVQLRRDRDHAIGRRSHLDDPATRAFHVEVLTRLTEANRADIHTLVVDGTLAGYSVAVRDGGVHRMWDGRLASGFERYSPGALTGYQALLKAMSDPGVTRVDWLRGMTVEKVHNEIIRRWSLRAGSGPVAEGASLIARGVVDGLKARVPDRIRRRVVAQ